MANIPTLAIAAAAGYVGGPKLAEMAGIKYKTREQAMIAGVISGAALALFVAKRKGVTSRLAGPYGVAGRPEIGIGAPAGGHTAHVWYVLANLATPKPTAAQVAKYIQLPYNAVLQNMVSIFQKYMGIKDDGIVGNDTWVALGKMGTLPALSTIQSTAAPAGPVAAPTVLPGPAGEGKWASMSKEDKRKIIIMSSIGGVLILGLAAMAIV
tara:strand:- start:356 stop:985 length:630 start_codon:yes stop_codon:yes gene_type:complete